MIYSFYDHSVEFVKLKRGVLWYFDHTFFRSFKEFPITLPIYYTTVTLNLIPQTILEFFDNVPYFYLNFLENLSLRGFSSPADPYYCGSTLRGEDGTIPSIWDMGVIPESSG